MKKSKTKLSAWLVSDCESSSNRDQLANKLQNYINVDIFGKCGNFTCSSQNPEKCVDMPRSTYKFYFAFENPSCVDYITENVFLSMQNDIIPIIFNGVRDIHNFLPPHSYINANNFNSIKELGDYLIFLDENPQEYVNYFWWKNYYEIIMHTKVQSYCDICGKINEWEPECKYQQYQDVERWFNNKIC